MGMSSRSAPRLLALLVASWGALVACNSSPVEPMQSSPSASQDASASEAATAGKPAPAVRERRAEGKSGFTSDALLASFSLERVNRTRGNHLVLFTHGSSSCPWRVRNVQVTGTYSVTITVGSRRGTKDHPCNLDDANRRQRVDLPVGIAARNVSEVRLTTKDGASHSASVAARH